MDSCELTSAISALALYLSQNMSEDRLSLLADVFNQLGDSLETISAQREFLKNKKIDSDISKKIVIDI